MSTRIRKGSSQKILNYSKLEPRKMLASASIQDVGGREVLLIDGCNSDDVAVVSDLSATQVRLTLNGVNQDFNKSDFVRIRFLGRNGDDQFTNNTDIDSAAFGHAGDDTLIGGNGHNWMQGGDGDDELRGGDKNDLLRGRGGNDTINGGKRHDRLFGAEGNDIITGESGNDLIYGDSGADQIFALNGDDRIMGADGSDTIQTGEGNDLVKYNRNYSAYTIFGDSELINVTANVGGEAVDTVRDAEVFQFADRTLSIDEVPTASRRVVVRPIIVSNSNGSNTAEFFGNADQENEIKRRIDELFSQADIDVFFENERTWNNSFANVGNGGTRPQSDLNSIVENGDAVGVGSSDSTVIDLYFVEVAPGFNDVGENTSNGLAFIDQSGVAVHVGDNLINSAAGRDVVARVVSHEIGHNLGLPHVASASNLMAESGAGTELTQGQITEIRNSDLVFQI